MKQQQTWVKGMKSDTRESGVGQSRPLGNEHYMLSAFEEVTVEEKEIDVASNHIIGPGINALHVNKLP